MLALFVLGAVALMIALGFGAVASTSWRGFGNYAPKRKVHHVQDPPGYELSSYENAVRAMHRMKREAEAEAEARDARNQPTEP